MAGDSGSNAAHYPDDGDERGIDWEFVYDEHSPRIRRIIERRAGTSITDDLLQETFERALRGESRFDLERPMAPWLNTIAFHLTSDVRRQRTNSGELLVDEPPDIVGPDVAEEAYIARIRRIGIRQALEGLNHRHRRVLEMIAIEGMTSEEVAEFEHMTTEAVKSVLARARVNFRANYTAFVEKMGIFGGAVVGPMVLRLRARLERYADVATNHACAITIAAVATAMLGIASVPATRPELTKATEERTLAVVPASVQRPAAVNDTVARALDTGTSDLGSASSVRAGTDLETDSPPPDDKISHFDTDARRTGHGATAAVEAGANTEDRQPRAFAIVEIEDCSSKPTSTAMCTVIDVLASTPDDGGTPP